MAKYNANLPQISTSLFLDTCGLETTLIFLENISLPEFAAFDLMRRDSGDDLLMSFYRKNAAIAADSGLGMIIETATWRASRDWALKLACPVPELLSLVRHSVQLLDQIRAEFRSIPIVISGCVGPRGDGYALTERMTASEAEDYHTPAIAEFSRTNVDLITALTMTYPEEAVGVALAARDANLPVAVSFTVETDGTLPSRHSLDEAIGIVDEATGRYPVYYMVNCAHPSHFCDTLLAGGANIARVRGVLANASRKSHTELNDSTELDSGDPVELANELAHLQARNPNLTIFGGCCGTDYRHIRELALTILPRT